MYISYITYYHIISPSFRKWSTSWITGKVPRLAHHPCGTPAEKQNVINMLYIYISYILCIYIVYTSYIHRIYIDIHKLYMIMYIYIHTYKDVLGILIRLSDVQKCWTCHDLWLHHKFRVVCSLFLCAIVLGGCWWVTGSVGIPSIWWWINKVKIQEDPGILFFCRLE